MSFFKAMTEGFKDGMAAGTKPTTANTATQSSQAIEIYDVVYKGGLLEYPKEKAGAIRLQLLHSEFKLVPTIGTKSWFRGLSIPYSCVVSVTIAQRTVSTLEGILGGLDSRQLNQANNIHIAFHTAEKRELLLRLEMLSGITVMGQASKCLEFMDRLKAHNIQGRFSDVQQRASAAIKTTDPIEQLEKLASLRDRGIISPDEFDLKKKDILSRM